MSLRESLKSLVREHGVLRVAFEFAAVIRDDNGARSTIKSALSSALRTKLMYEYRGQKVFCTVHGGEVVVNGRPY